MLTLFTVPKPFRGHVGDIQRNAIESWRVLHPELQIVLVGDEEGVAQAARHAGVEHVGGLVRNERGTPRLDSAFERVGTVARLPLWCMVNADIVLLDDFLPAIERVASRFQRFLVVGECRDLPLPAGIGLDDPIDRLRLRERALAEGRLRGYAALDYFVFPSGQFGPMPPFLIGRACFDNWLVWRVRQLGDPVVDATRSIVAVHQTHDYAHVAGGKDEAYYGEEARYNEKLAGGRSHIYTLHDASHRLDSRGAAHRYWGSTFRARERARATKVRAVIHMEVRRTRKREQSNRSRPIRLLGVFSEPAPDRTLVLDAVARLADLDLTVLYAKKGADNSEPSGPEPQHVHWFPRSVRPPGAGGLIGYAYPINWAIWNSFHGLRPDCMIVQGSHTFAAQAAVVWCLARRIPYLLVLDTPHPDERPRSRQAAKRALLSASVGKAAGAIVTTSAVRDSMLRCGMRPERVHVLSGAPDGVAVRVLELVRLALEDRATTNRGKLRLSDRILRS